MNRLSAHVRASASLFAALALSALPLVPATAAPLTGTTAVQTRPDAAAPLITFLKAGSEPVPAPTADAPAGWLAVSVPGPFTAYVQNQDLAKSLDVKTGSALYLKPSTDAGVLTTSVKGDSIAITGLHGKWTEVRLDKTLVGYIHIGPLAAAADGTIKDAPPPSDLSTASGPGKAAPAPSPDETALPRFFEGRFVSTHRLLSSPKPYSWQLNDASGARLAYLDVRKLLLTEQIDNYVGHDVGVYGAASRVPGTKDMVILLESLRLK